MVFLLSPSSVASEICLREMEEAIRLGKRILPVICRPLEGTSALPRLRERNYIFFYEDPNVADTSFGTGLAQLIAALDTNFDSCFISYSSKDEAFVERLYADLQNKGVRCWFAPHDMPIGAKIIDALDEA